MVFRWHFLIYFGVLFGFQIYTGALYAIDNQTGIFKQKKQTVLHYEINSTAMQNAISFMQNDSLSQLYKKFKLNVQVDNYKEEKTFFDTKELFLLKSNYALFLLQSEKENNGKRGDYNNLKKVFLENDSIYSYFNRRTKNGVISGDDKHPLLGKIKRNERQNFYELLKKLGLSKPEKLKKILNLESRFISHDLTSDNTSVGNLSIAFNTVEILGKEQLYVDVRLETESIQAELRQLNLEKLTLAIEQLIKTAIPSVSIKDKNQSIYQKAFYQVSTDFPFLEFHISNPYLFKIMQILFFFLFGSLLLLLFYRSRLLSN